MRVSSLGEEGTYLVDRGDALYFDTIRVKQIIEFYCKFA
jgi:hypothetical protein